MAQRSLLYAAAAAVVAAQDVWSCNFLTDPGVSCMLPWPDNFFKASTFNATAPGLRLSNTTLPLDNSGKGIDVQAGGWNDLKGFSPSGPYMAYIPGLSLTLSSCPRLWDIHASLQAGATTLLLNADDLTPVPHWVELDHSADGSDPTPYMRALILWPAHVLADGTRYIVAFRDLKDDDGMPVAPSDGFTALRDSVPTSNPALEASRERFEGIFTTLGNVGWDRSSLTLAWDFTTNTADDLTGRFIAMRDDALYRTGNGSEITYSIDVVTEAPRPGIARSIQGSFNVPLYLNSPFPGQAARLVLDPKTGLPVYNGLAGVNFTVLIPSSLAGNATSPPRAGKVLQYGHGLFGSQDEVNTGYLDDEANTHGYLLVAVDWWGLCYADEVPAALMIASDLSNFPMIPDRLHQGMLNAIMAMRFVTSSSFNRNALVTYGGVSVVAQDPADWHYFGNSQGGIMGQVYMAVTPDVTRGVSGVGGGPYGLLLPRSSDFTTLFDVIRVRYSRPLDAICIMAPLQALWDRMDPAGYVGRISGPNVLPNTPQHTIIFQAGLGDAQVSWLGVHTSARGANATAFVSMVREGNETLAGFNFVPDDTVVSTVGQNVIQMWDFAVPQVPFVNIPPADANDTHENTRRTATAQEMMARFFFTGEIVNTCGGACYDPNATARGEYL